jgi:probable F420-dependent oxidoreductase
MRFGLIESMCDPGHYVPLARTLEENGWDTFYAPDSLCYPREALPNQYPYYESREFLEDAPFLEPFSLIPALGAVTERLRFATDVLKLPVRPPVLVAKQVASVAVMTGGRFSLGVGLSPWVEDFQVMGSDWKSRAPRMEQMIEILRGLLSGEYYEFHSEYYDLPAIKLCPVPEQPVPILIGGHAPPALRRAARLGDGWISAGSDFAALEEMLRTLRRLLAERGRDAARFEIHAMAPPEAYALAGARRLRDRGVTHAIYSPRNPYLDGDKPLAFKQDFVKRLGDEVLTRL